MLIGRFGPLGHAAAVFLVTLGIVSRPRARCSPTRRRREAAGEKAGRALPSLLALLVGLMALFSMIPEGAVLDWSALYLSRSSAASVEAAGLAFAAFSATMALCGSAAIRSATGWGRC